MKRILVIDDASMMRKLLRLILEAKGYTVCGEASNGREGVEKYKQLSPDLVFCDLFMEGLNGIECFKEIKKINPNVKLVICTSSGQEWVKEQARAEGAAGLIIKPFSRADLIAMTEQIFRDMDGESVRSAFEKQAQTQGLSNRDILNFYDAFYMTTGIHIDDKRVTKAFLEENLEQVEVGVKAFLSAKETRYNIEKIIRTLHSL